MDHFNYRNGELYCEDVPAERIAREVGPPAYVYSRASLLHHYKQLADAFAPLRATICYSVKSCGNVNICKLLAKQGCGFDVTSGGELFRALQAGGDPKKIIYAGVGKTDEEIRDAIERWRRVIDLAPSGDFARRARREARTAMDLDTIFSATAAAGV
jgi:diaminopimelate decarboxylase